MKSPVCLLPFLLVAPAWCAEDTTILDWLPSDTQIVFGVRVRAVVDSELARSLSPEIQNSGADWQKLISLAGFDPLHDVDEVVFASSGEGPKAPALIVARGTFDVARLGASGEDYHGVPVVSGKTKADGVFAFVDGSTALAGDPASVKAAIDRRGSPASLAPAMSARIAQYRERYDIWGIVNRPGGLAQYIPPSAKSSGLDSIDRFQLGIALKKGVELAAEVHARTAKDAGQLAATLQFLEGMSRASQPSPSAGTRFTVKNEANTLKIALVVSEQDLKKAIETQRQRSLVRSIPAAPRTPGPVRIQSSDTAAAPVPPPPDGGTTVFTLPAQR